MIKLVRNDSVLGLPAAVIPTHLTSMTCLVLNHALTCVIIWLCHISHCLYLTYKLIIGIISASWEHLHIKFSYTKLKTILKVWKSPRSSVTFATWSQFTPISIQLVPLFLCWNLITPVLIKGLHPEDIHTL